MPTVADLTIVISAVDRASGAIAQTQEAALRAQERSVRAVRNIGLVMTGVGAAALLMGRQASQGFQQLEQSFANVSTLLPPGVDAMELFGDEVARMARELPVAGGQLELVNGLYQVLSAGITDTADAMVVLEVATKAARAGMTDSFTAVDVLTSLINAYGLSAEDATRASDVLFVAVARGKITFGELSTVMGRLISVAPTLGIGMEEVAAAMATLTRIGLPAEQAATALGGAMNALLKPTPAVKDALAALGFASAEAAIEELGLVGTLQALRDSVGENEEAFREMFPNVESLRAILPLTGVAAEGFRADLDAMTGSLGATEAAFAKTADTWASRSILAKNRLDAVTLSIGAGATPAMVQMTETMATLGEGLASVNEATGGTIGAIITYGGAALSTIGPMIALIAQVKLMAIARALETGAHHQSTLAMIKSAIAAHGLKIAMIAIPIFAIITAIVLLITHWEEVTGAMRVVWDFLVTHLGPAFDFLTDVVQFYLKVLQEVAGFLVGVFGPVLDALAGGVEGLKQAFLDFALWLVNFWVDRLREVLDLARFFSDLGQRFITWLVDGILGVAGQLWDVGVRIAQAILDGIWATITGAGDFFKGIADQIVSFFTGSPQLDPRLEGRFAHIGEMMGEAVSGGLAAGVGEAEAAMDRTLGRLQGRAGSGAAGGGGGSAVVHFHRGAIVVTASDPADFAEKVDRALMDQLRRRGVTVGLGG